MSIQYPNSSHPPSFPLWYPYVCSVHLYLYFWFLNRLPIPYFFKFHILIYAFLCETCFCLSVHPCLYRFHSFCDSNTPLYMCTASAFIHSSVDRFRLFPCPGYKLNETTVNIGVRNIPTISLGICPVH